MPMMITVSFENIYRLQDESVDVILFRNEIMIRNRIDSDLITFSIQFLYTCAVYCQNTESV